MFQYDDNVEAEAGGANTCAVEIGFYLMLSRTMMFLLGLSFSTVAQPRLALCRFSS